MSAENINIRVRTLLYCVRLYTVKHRSGVLKLEE